MAKLVRTKKSLSSRDIERKELLSVFKDDAEPRNTSIFKKNLKAWSPFIKIFRTWDRTYIYPMLWVAFDQFAQEMRTSPLENGEAYATELEYARTLCYKLATFERATRDQTPDIDDYDLETELLTEFFEYFIENRGKWWW